MVGYYQFQYNKNELCMCCFLFSRSILRGEHIWPSWTLNIDWEGQSVSQLSLWVLQDLTGSYGTKVEWGTAEQVFFTWFSLADFFHTGTLPECNDVVSNVSFSYFLTFQILFPFFSVKNSQCVFVPSFFFYHNNLGRNLKVVLGKKVFRQGQSTRYNESKGPNV